MSLCEHFQLGQDICAVCEGEVNCINDVDLCGTADASQYIKLIQTIKAEHPDTRWDRSTELYRLVEAEPDALVDCGSQTQGLSQWQNLASFVPPQNVLDRLDELGKGWRLLKYLKPIAAPRTLDHLLVSLLASLSILQPVRPSLLMTYSKKFI